MQVDLAFMLCACPHVQGQQAGQERVWSTSPAIMSTLSDYAVAASVQVRPIVVLQRVCIASEEHLRNEIAAGTAPSACVTAGVGLGLV
jgi:hypothetical protein